MRTTAVDVRVPDDDGPAAATPAPAPTPAFRRHLRAEVRAGKGAYLFSEQGVIAMRGAKIESLAALQARPAPADAVVMVGPEGGWTEPEWRAAHQRGVRLITLGHRTLRADAVPIAAISVLQFVWGDL